MAHVISTQRWRWQAVQTVAASRRSRVSAGSNAEGGGASGSAAGRGKVAVKALRCFELTSDGVAVLVGTQRSSGARGVDLSLTLRWGPRLQNLLPGDVWVQLVSSAARAVQPQGDRTGLGCGKRGHPGGAGGDAGGDGEVGLRSGKSGGIGGFEGGGAGMG
eukprot:4166597-Pleurochrysis_carterae.AAC.1